MKVSQINKTVFGANIRIQEGYEKDFFEAISPTKISKRKEKRLQAAFDQICSVLTTENETVLIGRESNRKRFSLKAKIEHDRPWDLVATIGSNKVELARLHEKHNSPNWADLVIKAAKVLNERYTSLHKAMKNVIQK